MATATKALQDQLAAKDLPFLEAHLGRPFDWAVLKGRSNYICMQRVRELQSTEGQGQLEIEDFAATTKVEIKRLCEWSGDTKTGDQADLTWSPADRSWQAVSVGSDECPGATKCPMGGVCFAELARARASVADVVVVNLHLYGLNVASGNMLLPEHDVVVIDEAHQLEDIMSDTVGVQIGPGRFTNLAAVVRRVIEDPAIVGGLAESAPAIREALRSFAGDRLTKPFPDTIQDALIDARGRIEKAQSALRAINTDVPEAQQRKMRAQQVATRVQEQIDMALGPHEGYVAFVSGSPDQRAAGDRSARRRAGAVVGDLDETHRNPHQRDPAGNPRASCWPCGWVVHPDRCRKPVRLRHECAAVLRAASSRSSIPAVRRRGARRVGGVDHCSGWPHPWPCSPVGRRWTPPRRR